MDRLDIIMSLVRASRDEIANILKGEFCPIDGKSNCEDLYCKECWDKSIKNKNNSIK